MKSEDIARTNQIILERGKNKILLADHSKTKAVGNFAFAELSDFDLWITTVGIEEELMQNYRNQTSPVRTSVVNTTSCFVVRSVFTKTSLIVTSE